MSFTINIFGLFRRRKSLRDFTMADLRKNRLMLDNEERRLEGQMCALDDERKRLLGEYRLAKTSGDAGLLKRAARKARKIDIENQAADRRHKFVNDQMQSMAGLMCIKEDETFYKRVGLGDVLGRMSLEELEDYVREAQVDGEMNREKMRHILQSMAEANDTGADEEKASLADYMAGLDAEIEQTPGEEALADARLDDAIAILEQELPKAAVENELKPASAQG